MLSMCKLIILLGYFISRYMIHENMIHNALICTRFFEYNFLVFRFNSNNIDFFIFMNQMTFIIKNIV